MYSQLDRKYSALQKFIILYVIINIRISGNYIN